MFQDRIVDKNSSMIVATIGAAGLFLSHASVDREYRPALLVSGFVVSMACDYYFVIRHRWHAAHALSRDGYLGSGAGFNEKTRLLEPR